MDDLPRARGVEALNLTLSAGAVAASLALAGPAFSASVAVGAVLEAVNFRAFRRGAELLFRGEIAGSGPVVGAFALRFAGLAVALAVALAAGAHPVGLLVGLSLIVPSVVIWAVRNRPPVRECPPGPPPDDPSWDLFDPWLAREREPRDDEDDA